MLALATMAMQEAARTLLESHDHPYQLERIEIDH